MINIKKFITIISLFSFSIISNQISISFASSDEVAIDIIITESTNQINNQEINQNTIEDIARYVAILEQNDVTNKVDDEHKLSIEIEMVNLLYMLNEAPENINPDTVNYSIKLIEDILVANNLYGEIEPLTEDNINEIEQMLLEDTTIFNYPLLSYNDTEGNRTIDDLRILIDSIQNSNDYNNSISDEKRMYESVLKFPKRLLEFDEPMLRLFDLDWEYTNLLNNIKVIEAIRDPNSIYYQNVNKDSKFFTNPFYRVPYLRLSKSQQDELDSMEIESDNTAHLSLNEVSLSGRYGLPVFREEWIYPFMKDGNTSGMVGEGYNNFSKDDYIRNLYRITPHDKRIILNSYDKNKDGYIDYSELEVINDDLAWINDFRPKDVSKDDSTPLSLLPDTTNNENNKKSVFYVRSSTREAYEKLTDEQKIILDQINTDGQWPLSVDEVRASGMFDIPVLKERDWIYPFMLDRNGDGKVGDVYYEDGEARSSEEVSTNPTPETQTLTDNINPVNIIQTTPTPVPVTTTTPEPVTITTTQTTVTEAPTTTLTPTQNSGSNVAAHSNVNTGVGGSTAVIVILFTASIAYFTSKKNS